MANFVTDVFGDTPNVAPYIKTIFSDEQLKALNENIAAMPDITKLGGDYYDYMMGLMERSIPGFQGILAEGGKLTSQMQSTAAEELAGKIPQDVVDQVQRSSAFQNLLSGGGGGMASANAARNYGLTSLDMITKGQQSAEAAGNAAQRWSGIASGFIMNPASFFVSPQEQAAMTMQNNLYKQATQQLRNNLSAAPDPVAAGVSNTIMNVIGAYIGHGALGAGGGSSSKPGATGSSGGASGAGTSALGLAGTTFTPGNLNFGGIPDIFNANANVGAPVMGSENPNAFNVGAMPFQPTFGSYGETLGMSAPPYNPYNLSLQNFQGAPSQTDISSLLSLSPTGTTDFWGGNVGGF